MPKKKGTTGGRGSKKGAGDLRPRKDPAGGGGGVPGAPTLQAGGVPGAPSIAGGGVPGSPTLAGGGVPGGPSVAGGGVPGIRPV